MKNILKLGTIALFLSTSLFSSTVTKEQCEDKGNKFIYAGAECLELAVFKGEREGMLNIIVHGTWKKGTNTLGRYAPFAETINMNTDITTVAVSLPGYSKSSTNRFDSLTWGGAGPLSAQKEYVDFVADVIKALKRRYNADTTTYIGHSAGAMIGATLAGYKPALLNNLVAVGGVYDVYNDKKKDGKNATYPKGLYSAVKFLDEIEKDTKILLVYGTKDDISYPEFTTNFYNKLKKEGIDTKIVKVQGAGHIDLDMTDPSVEAITTLLEE
jgi:predicted esterase